MKSLRFVAIVGTFVLGTACVTTDPYTGEEKLNKKSAGAAIGVIGGAAAGSAAKGNKGRNMAIGAAVGGLIGLSVGAYMDKQEDELRNELKGTGVSVTRDGDRLILNMPGNVTFATGQSTIKPSFHQVLGSVAKVLKKFDDTSIRVAGHTDSVGSDASNMTLSKARAGSVGSFLATQDIANTRIKTVGYGESAPIASNDSANGRAQNRRVELELVKITH